MAGYRDTLFGGQSLFTRTTSPAAGQNTQQQSGAGTAGGASGGANAGAGATQQRPMQTFSQLQQHGIARPAPPPPQFQQYQQYGGSQQAQQTRTGLQQQVQQAMANPGRYNSQAYQQIEGAARQGLDANYQRQLSAMNEDMARRGLSSATYAGQNWQDITRGYNTDIATLNAELLRDAAQTNAQDQLAASQMGLDFANLAGSQDLAEFEANRVGQAMNNEQALAQAQFGQSQYEFDQDNALQAAIAQGNLGTDQSRLMLDELLGLGNLDVRQGELDQNNAQFGQDLALRQQLGLGELGVQQGRLGLDNRALDSENQQFQQQLGFTGVQNELDRGLQRGLQNNQLGFGREQLAQEGQQFNRQLGFEGEQNALQRQLQQALQGNELGFNREQLAQQGSQFQQQLGFEGEQNNLQRQLQQLMQGNELGFNREQLAQQGQQFDRSASQADLQRTMQERLATQEMSGYMGNGQRTVARDQATADADLARQNLLATLLGALGLNANDFGAGGTGGGAGGGTLGGSGGGASGGAAGGGGLTQLPPPGTINAPGGGDMGGNGEIMQMLQQYLPYFG
jgi:hypothetical protein